MIVRSRSPVRISFGGGGTDVPPYCDEKGGCVVSAAINKYSYATLESRNDQEIHIESWNFLKKLKFGSIDEIEYNNELDLLKAAIKKMNTTRMGLNIFLRSEVPPKSGLGSSAAAFVALIGLFNHIKAERMTPYEIAEIAHEIERKELKIAGGKQDQYASVFGGLNFIEFGSGWVRVSPLGIKKDHLLELEKNLILVHVGERPTTDVVRNYITGDIITDQVKSVVEKKETVIEALDKTKEIALEMKKSLLTGDLMKFGDLLHEAWEQKKKFSPMITNRRINDLYDLARRNGALGGKLTGAGGGGFMLFFCESNTEQIVSNELEKAGAKPVNFVFDFDGLQTWEVSHLTTSNMRTRTSSYYQGTQMSDKIIERLKEHTKSIDSILTNKEIIGKIEALAKKIVESYKRGGKLVIFGNGGSASDAQHIVAELVNKFYLDRPMLNAIALNVNTSVITAIANDISYDDIFARQIEHLVDNRDVVIGLSTSGKSRNVINALQMARNKGALVAGFTGETGGLVKNYVDILINIPSNDTPRIQEAHITVGHIICELVEAELWGKK